MSTEGRSRGREGWTGGHGGAGHGTRWGSTQGHRQPGVGCRPGEDRRRPPWHRDHDQRSVGSVARPSVAGLRHMGHSDRRGHDPGRSVLGTDHEHVDAVARAQQADCGGVCDPDRCRHRRFGGSPRCDRSLIARVGAGARVVTDGRAVAPAGSRGGEPGSADGKGSSEGPASPGGSASQQAPSPSWRPDRCETGNRGARSSTGGRRARGVGSGSGSGHGGHHQPSRGSRLVQVSCAKVPRPGDSC